MFLWRLSEPHHAEQLKVYWWTLQSQNSLEWAAVVVDQEVSRTFGRSELFFLMPFSGVSADGPFVHDDDGAGGSSQRHVQPRFSPKVRLGVSPLETERKQPEEAGWQPPRRQPKAPSQELPVPYKHKPSFRAPKRRGVARRALLPPPAATPSAHLLFDNFRMAFHRTNRLVAAQSRNTDPR